MTRTSAQRAVAAAPAVERHVKSCTLSVHLMRDGTAGAVLGVEQGDTRRHTFVRLALPQRAGTTWADLHGALVAAVWECKVDPESQLSLF